MTRLLYRTAGFGLFSNSVLAVVLAAGTFSFHPRALHLVWLGSILLVTAGRWALNVAYERAQPAPEDLPRWRARFTIGLVAAGLNWGVAGWFYFQINHLLPTLLLVVILAGMNAGAARSLASVPLHYRLYVVVTLTPLLLRFLTLEGAGGITLALAMLTYALFLMNTAKLHHADLRQLWHLIFRHEPPT